MLVLISSLFFVGLALGSIAVASVAYADEHGSGPVASYLLSAFGAGALVGGLGYGARRWSGPPERLLRILVALLALGFLPLSAVPGVAAMTALAGLAGVFLAPALACAFIVVDRHAPGGTVTEAFSWLVTTFGVGAAAGTAAVGPAIERGGAAAGFTVPGLAGSAALLVLLVTRKVLAVPGRARSDEASAENDRNGDLEAGFATGHRA
jgi:predicted MFS family arabinose efflux permease